MIAYEAGQWHDLFTVAGEAAAGLGGLLFVAVSLNHKDILSEPRLPPLAARSLGVLLSILLMSVPALTPGQSRTTLGAELTALGVVLVGAVTISVTRLQHRALLRLDPPHRDTPVSGSMCCDHGKYGH